MKKSKFLNAPFTVMMILSMTFGALGITPAFAATTITVDTTVDEITAADGSCSLSEAITNANNDTQIYSNAGECAAGSGTDTIDFDPTMSGLTITLSSALPNIASNMTIDGSSLELQVTISGNDAVRVFYVNSGVTAELNSLKVTHAYIPSGEGAGLRNDGTLTVTNSTFDSNVSNGQGGGITNFGTLTVKGSTFSNNRVTALGCGAGINNGGNLYVFSSTFISNSAVGCGGGISGGGSPTSVTIANSTFYNNTAVNWTGGGVFSANDTLNITNSTFYGNTAASQGGGISVDVGTLNLANTIIANSGGTDCYSAPAIGINLNNLIQDGSCFSDFNGDPLLNGLASNGGPTQTMGLQDGSSAINMGDDTVCANYPVNGLDQRGYARGESCDIGAYELDTTPPVVTVPGDITAEATSASGAAVNFTVSAQDDVDGALTPTCDHNSGDTFPLGATTVSCSATDAASNTGSASFNILVEDTTPPDTAIDTHPTNPYSSSAAVFTFSGSDSASNIASFECKVDAGSFTACASSDNFGPLSAGSHTFEVRALDATGNTDPSPASFSWTINLTPPIQTLILKSSGPHDGWIKESSETSNTGSYLITNRNAILVGDDNGDQQIRMILSFPTSELPDQAKITSATLKFKWVDFLGGNPFVTHGLLRVDIRKGAFSGNAELEASDFSATSSKDNVLSFGSIYKPKYDWYIKSLSLSDLGLINENGVTQFRLRFNRDDDDDRSGDYLRIFSGDAVEASRPQLIIEYTLPAP